MFAEKGAILKILTHREKVSINLQVTHWVQFVHLMKQKTDANFIEEKIIENFSRDLKELEIEIIHYKEKEMTTLTSDEVTLYESQNVRRVLLW